MTLHRGKLAIGSAVIVGAMAYLGIAAAGSGWVYYVDVDELGDVGRRVRVHGIAQSLEAGPRSANFDLVGSTRRVRVRYDGGLPPMLKEGGQVVAEGTLGPDGVFRADALLTKCASKYEPADHPETPR